ncbi:MAG: hypothetical protein R2719_11105 [Micropruina sp.]
MFAIASMILESANGCDGIPFVVRTERACAWPNTGQDRGFFTNRLVFARPVGTPPK